MHLNHHHLQNKRDFDGMSTSSSRKEKRQYKKRKHKAQREVIKQGKISSQYASFLMRFLKKKKVIVLPSVSHKYCLCSFSKIFFSSNIFLELSLNSANDFFFLFWRFSIPNLIHRKFLILKLNFIKYFVHCANLLAENAPL